MDKQEKIIKEKIEKYREITGKALAMAEKNIVKGKEKQGKEIIEMVSCYLSDSKHFESKEDLINSLSCLSYAHGWLDAGARLKIFNVKDNRLFTV